MAEKNEKVYAKHIIIHSRPVKLCLRVVPDLAYSRNELNKGFLGHSEYADRLSVFFQLFDATV